MRLSIIIPVYNAAKFLSICLDGLLQQNISASEYEILIINDGSTDESLSVANLYCKEHNNIKVFTKKNGGVGSARNKGMSLATGDYIYFIDPDDYLAINSLDLILSLAEDNKLDILTFQSQPTTDSKLYHSEPNKTGLELSKIVNGEDYIADNFYKNEAWWFIINRTFLEKTKLKFIEDRWMEDAIFTTKLFLEANFIANLPINVHRHLLVEGSAMTSNEPKHYLKVIDDQRNATLVFESIIEKLEQKNSNKRCISRLRIRQQSFVFFMMVRILKSTMSLKQVKIVIDEISLTNAYPLKSFIGEDYNKLTYKVLVKIFNSERLFYLFFRIFNPILK